VPPTPLAELLVPSRTALLLQEVQRGVVGDLSALPELAAAAARVELIPHAVALAAAARATGAHVVHCTAENLPGGFGVNRNARLFAGARKAGADNVPGSESVSPVPELGPEPGDHVLPRYHGLSPLTGGPLDTLLRNSGVTTVIVAGVSSNLAIPNIVFDAVNRSYQVVLVTDAIAGVPDEYTAQIVRGSLSLIATLATTRDVLDALAPGRPVTS